jgi:hypothetical protein
MLPSAVRFQSAVDFAKDVLLPWKQEKRLACRLPLRVLQHFLKKREHTLGLGLVDARTANRAR